MIASRRISSCVKVWGGGMGGKQKGTGKNFIIFCAVSIVVSGVVVVANGLRILAYKFHV